MYLVFQGISLFKVTNVNFVVFMNSFLMASFRSHVQELCESGNEGKSNSMQYDSRSEGDISKLFSGSVNCSSSPESTRSYSDRQLETFNHRHGLLILHLLAALMFVPSLVSWLQVCLVYYNLSI